VHEERESTHVAGDVCELPGREGWVRRAPWPLRARTASDGSKDPLRDTHVTHRRFVSVLLSSLGLFVAAGLLLAHFGLGLSGHSVLSDSMRPTFAAGDHILTLNSTPQGVHRGQVVIVQTPAMPAPIAHRVVDVKIIADAVSVRTKGDANASPDPWTNLLPGSKIPVVISVLPGSPEWLRHGPSTWGTGLKISVITVLGLIMTTITVALQWRGRDCDCLACLDGAPCLACQDGQDGHMTGTNRPERLPPTADNNRSDDAAGVDSQCPNCGEEPPASADRASQVHRGSSADDPADHPEGSSLTAFPPKL
jgi:signal peptidase I